MVIYNSVKANPDKYQFIILGNTGSHTLRICDIIIKSSSSVTLFGITFDSKLNFKEHINHIVKKAYYKQYALRRIRKFLTLEKAKSSLFNDRKLICLLPINLDVTLRKS